MEGNQTPLKDAFGDKLCFDKNEFLKENFSIDEFLHKNRNVSSLELLRDNLGLHLKGLRSSMIDLINEDYADFVSLSANLIGLDQSIATIQTPLEDFRQEISEIKTMIDENISEVQGKLERKRQLRELKRNLMSLKKVYEIRQKLEDLLANQLSTSGELKVVDLERAALDVVQLKFNEKFCAEYLDEESRDRSRKLELEVHRKLRTLLCNALKTTNTTSSEPLERCLRIYITLDSCAAAEAAFKEDVVAPYMADIISEQSLQQTPQGLAGIYSKILNFISMHMTDILRLTQYTDNLKGFNFVVNSFWSEVEMRLENHMPSIFAPGNSEIFYSKYKCTLDFLSKIEELLANKDAVEEFRRHKQTKSFKSRWNLPVYFQICFQEIAGKFEFDLEPLLKDDSFNGPSETFQLKVFTKAIQATERSWSEGVFLLELFPKFYKLYVQILLRLSQWIQRVLLSIGAKNVALPTQIKKTNLLVALHSDIYKLLESIREQQHNLILCRVKASSSCKMQEHQLEIVKSAVEKSFDDLKNTFTQCLLDIQKALVENLIEECGPDNVRQVNDLPRLYRKTNREVPARCSSYVDQMFKPLKNFNEEFGVRLSSSTARNVLQVVLNKMTTDYLDSVRDVLTSVQKTEESLRRLRNFKGSGNQAAALANTSMSDDDKIRLQLCVDVSTWTNNLAKLGFLPSDITNLQELNDVVEESVKNSKE